MLPLNHAQLLLLCLYFHFEVVLLPLCHFPVFSIVSGSFCCHVFQLCEREQPYDQILESFPLVLDYRFFSFLREAKPGGFQTPGVSHFFRERSRLCRGPFREIGREKRKRTNRENFRTIPEQIGKIPEKSGKSQKGQKRTKKEAQVQIGPNSPETLENYFLVTQQK